MDNQFIKVGKIVNTFGIRGELKIYLYTDFPKERFEKGNRLYIGNIEKPNQLEVEIQSSKPYKNMYLIKLRGFDNINDVEKYKNLYLWIMKEQQGELEEGEYYYHQIIGCNVVTTDGQELGVVKEILSPGANDVWVVRPHKGTKELLIPYIDPVVKDVDIDNKKIVIEVIEGLLD
ncbi:ribosome maturation factor RimM [Vulcanibacillus modesticaldus]|uniref:Ribosome maturation factor RimM n=1 Tax=Vulcanibacillus modesticaldus TaxID=337097 RepID=A0A1D2YXA5_9BACI|nr:ribosome maturation factor RimM [Vulcanibacillus modesticaldus]OEG00375.1 ribosome maturation factor RimM [Vulcanibacillus modesticaldus]